MFLAKNAHMLFFFILVLLFAFVERLCFSRMRVFFIPYLKWKFVISYSYFSIGKIMVLAFLHTLKIIHSWDNVVIKFTESQPDSDFCHNKHRPTTPTLYLWHTYPNYPKYPNCPNCPNYPNSLGMFQTWAKFPPNMLRSKKYWLFYKHSFRIFCLKLWSCISLKQL